MFDEGTVEESFAYSTVDEDYDDCGECIDIIDMVI